MSEPNLEPDKKVEETLESLRKKKELLVKQLSDKQREFNVAVNNRIGLTKSGAKKPSDIAKERDDIERQLKEVNSKIEEKEKQ